MLYSKEQLFKNCDRWLRNSVLVPVKFMNSDFEVFLFRKINFSFVYTQACQELIQRREKVLERACYMDDEFSKREKAYKVQVRQVVLLLSSFSGLKFFCFRLLPSNHKLMRIELRPKNSTLLLKAL